MLPPAPTRRVIGLHVDLGQVPQLPRVAAVVGGTFDDDPSTVASVIGDAEACCHHTTNTSHLNHLNKFRSACLPLLERRN